MRLEDMQFIKLKRDKTPREKLTKTYNYEDIEYYADLGVIVQEPFIVLDVDDQIEFLKLREIIIDKNIRCNIMRTTRGGHFWFKSDNPLKNNVKIQTPIGIDIDVRSYGKLCYTKIKQEGEWRDWVQPLYPFDELEELPFWLIPINHGYDLVGMKNGDGRNDLLYSYIIVLNNYLSKDKVRETYYIINEYILGDKLDYKELETILRDESFSNLRPNFFDKSRFLFDKFSKWMINNYKLLRKDRLIYMYDEKHYTSDVALIESIMLKHIPSLSRSQRLEVLEYLRLTAPEVPDVSFYYIICKNYIIDVRDGKKYNFTQDFFLPNIINSTYDETVKEHEDIDNFMKKVCCEDQEVIDLIYEMIGYCLINSSKYQKSFILYGDGSNRQIYIT